MSARELHRYIRTGRKRLSFKDIKPFVDKNVYSLILPGRVLAYSIGKKRKEGVGIPEKSLLLLGLLKENGILVHPMNLEVCVQIEANGLNIDGVPFQVYFHQLSKKGFIGGTFMHTNDEKGSFVFLSLPVAIHLISSYLASNNLRSIRINEIGSRFLMQKYTDGSLKDLPKEKAMELLHHLLGTRLFESEINRLFAENSGRGYMELVEATLNSIAMHEAAHVLHRRAGILGSGGIEKEEERAYLTELAYGNAGLVFPYLPVIKKDDPNCTAGRRIIERFFHRNDFAYLMNAGKDQLSGIAKGLLDEDFKHDFGAHHDEIIPRIEIERVRRHRFFSDKHLPMFERLRYLPEREAA